MTLRIESFPPPGAPYQAWLRRRIATLEALQSQRIELVAEQKLQMNASIVKAQREIDNLRTQQTIGSVSHED